jgi:hypothetical protein
MPISTKIIVRGVIRREPTIEFQSAVAASLQGLSDIEVLSRAADQGRLLVSHDRKTMPRYFAELIRRRNSPGLILISQKTSPLIAIESLLLLWEASEAADWTNRVIALPF